MKCSLTAVVLAALIIAGTLGASLQAAVPVVWDGSAGPDTTSLDPDSMGKWRWEQGNWTKNGTPGQTAVATMGDNNAGRGGMDIILGSGDQVYYDTNRSCPADPGEACVNGALGDFKPRMDVNGPGSLTITEDAVLSMRAKTDIDGRWTRVGMDINLDNGTLIIQHAAPSNQGGNIIFGYQNELLPNTQIDFNVTNGGLLQNNGKIVFGNPRQGDFGEYETQWGPDENPISGDNPSTGHNPGIGIAMTINDGTLDLTGGRNYPDEFLGFAAGELTFFYETIGPGAPNAGQPKGETYSINFTGPGQIIIDTGIFVATQSAAGVFSPKNGLAPDLYHSITYQDLWSLEILQANGLSGLDPDGPGGPLTGSVFSNYFTTTGSPDEADDFGTIVVDHSNYTLTSLLAAPGLDGDHNEDGVVNAADYPAWRKIPSLFGGDPGGYNDWRTNFGESGPGGSGAVPEPVSLVPVMIGVVGLWIGRRGLLHVR